MLNGLDQVRALVNAKIEARKRFLEEKRREAEGMSCKMCCMSEPPMPRHPGRFPARRLPENLDVPPVESRPPNLNAVNLSFAARLVIAVRDKFNGDAPKVYAAANISRQAYSQIVSDETRPVSKRTAVRFAFALKSTPDEARLLLKSAGYAFSNSQTEDFILQACLEVNPPIWDLNVVNLLLKEYRVDFQY